MTRLIGVDEAGYGPNLGPLVIAATSWDIPDGLAAEDCDALVAPWITRDLPPKADARFWVADSKQIYKPGGGLPALERHVLPFLSLIDGPPASITDLWSRVAPESAADRFREPWYNDDLPLPVAPPQTSLHDRANTLRAQLASVGITLHDIRARITSPERFNAILDNVGSKGVILSETTLQLVASLWPAEFDHPTLVYCDRHGGRARYADLLQHVAGDHMVRTLSESSELSRYRIGATEARFAVRSERYLPVALASMVAKYLRELLMQQFNAWWQLQQPGLAPTAGYPLDAKRFWTDTAATHARLQLPDHILWRRK